MANEYFTASGNPATRATATSASMRAEFAAIVAGFDKLPTMTGNGGKLLVVNSAGTALTASSTIYEVSGKIGIATATPGTALGFVNGAQISWGASNYAYVSGSNATNVLTFGTQATERMRIDASGNLSVGTATATSRVTVAGDVRTLAGGTLILNNPTNTAAGSVGFVTGDNLVFYGGGSTERMRIDASGNVGIGLTSPTNKLDVNGTVGFWASGTQIGSAFNDSLALNLQANNNATSGLKLGTSGSTPIAAYTNGSERMRIDASGNVGVGTSSPVNNGRNVTVSNSGTGAATLYLQNSTTGATITDGLLLGLTGSDGQLWNYENATLQFGTNNTERMRIDASGNLGVGTTSPNRPITISNTNAQIQFVNATTGTTATDGLLVGMGGAASADAYINQQENANLVFNTNATERVRIDASGRLKAGTTGNPVSSLIRLLVQGDATTGGAVELVANGGGGVVFDPISGGGITISRFTGAVGAETYTSSLTVDSSGNLGVGTSSPGYKLDVAGSKVRVVNAGSTGFLAANTTSTFNMEMGADATGGYLYIGQAAPMVFSTNATERMRIDSTGRLLHGTTSASVTNGGFLWVPGADSIGYIGHASGSASGNGFFAFQLAGVQIGSITQNGTTAVAYNTSSDYRLKDITGPVTGSGEYIDALNPVVGSWKADGAPFVGLIAHEVQDISSTQVATGVKDGEVMQSMDYSAPEIMANIIAELKSLRARVANLEAA